MSSRSVRTGKGLLRPWIVWTSYGHRARRFWGSLLAAAGEWPWAGVPQRLDGALLAVSRGGGRRCGARRAGGPGPGWGGDKNAPPGSKKALGAGGARGIGVEIGLGDARAGG